MGGGSGGVECLCNIHRLLELSQLITLMTRLVCVLTSRFHFLRKGQGNSPPAPGSLGISLNTLQKNERQTCMSENVFYLKQRFFGMRLI